MRPQFQGQVEVEQRKNRQQHHVRIASLVPGRLRIKVHPNDRSPEVLRKIQGGLESQEGIHEVRTNNANGSVTVRYDHQRHSTAGVFGLLEDLDVIIESAGHMAGIEEAATSGEGSTTQAGFITAIEDLNARVYAMTGVPIDLKLALPLAFVGAGFWSIGKKGLMIESVPGWLFLWFAFDMFVKLHPSHR